MGDAIVQALPSAVVVAISPVPIVAVVLMLLAARGRVNGPAFVLGWMIGLATVGAVCLSVASGGDSGTPAERDRWISVVLVVSGVLLLLVALKQWRGRSRAGGHVIAPRWLDAFDTFSPVKAAGAGVVFSMNPKNLLLAFAGAAEIVQTGISADRQVVAYVVFVVIATMGIGTPLLIHLAMGDRSRQLLEHLKSWMIRNSAVIMAVLSFIIGVKLIADGISRLARVI